MDIFQGESPEVFNMDGGARHVSDHELMRFNENDEDEVLLT